jgi:ATP/maltotriose-dependent transcriptional regulator MalT
VTPLVRYSDTTARAFALDQQIALIGAALVELGNSRSRAPLLCLDNVHLVQGDPAIFEVLRHLVAATPATLLLTSRTDLSLPGVVSVRLHGLEREEGLSLIGQIGNSLEPALAERLLDKTGGSPMLLRLAIGHLRDRQADPAGAIAHLEQAPQVASYLLETMLQQLQPPAWRVLSLVSVFRQPINLYDDMLVELSQAADGPYDLAAAVAEVQRRHLIDHPAQAVLHRLVRDHISATLASDLPRKRRLHRIAAEWSELVAGNIVESAYHYARAAELERAVAILTDQRKLLISGGQSYAAVEVVDDLLSRVRRRRGATADLARQLLAIRGDLLVGTLRAAEAEADYRQALELTTQPALRADLVARLSLSLLQRNQYAQALQLCQAATADLGSTDTVLLARLATFESMAHHNLSRYDQAERSARHALALIDQVVGAPPGLLDETQVRAYSCLADIMRIRRDYASALNLWRRAIAIARRGGVRRLEYSCLGNIGGVLYDQGDIQGSLQARTEALAGAQANGDSNTAAYFLVHVAATQAILREYAAALEKLDQAVEILRHVGDLRGLISAENERASVLIAIGRATEARADLEQVLDESAHMNTLRARGYALNKLALVQLVEGDPAAARATIEQALAMPAAGEDQMLRIQLHNSLALVLLAVGAATTAHETLARAPFEAGSVSVWVELDRQLITALVALAHGNTADTVTAAGEVAQRSRANGYPLYQLRADRLIALAAAPPPPAAFARLLWVEDDA